MKILQRLSKALLASLLLTLPIFAQAQSYDLPDRVARLSLVRGDVSMAPGGSDNWSVADRNRPLLRGDRLYTGDGSRAVLEMGDASLRIDDRSAVDLVVLNDQRTQIQLTQGTVNLAVHRLDRDQIYEIDTPTMAFVADRPGSYRIDVDPSGYGAMVTVFSGQGSVWGEGNSSQQVASGRSYRFDHSDVGRVRISSIPSYNEFDRFCADLDSGYAHSVSSRYVADNVIGYRDLDRYGTWRSNAEYGQVWFPSQVNIGWAPYRDGRWTWIEPWGWTWVDNAPWGFAPFHYGRWARVHVGNVSISIGGTSPVGWFPLGPRDIYQPPYRVTENYFININMGNGRFFHRNSMQSHWSDYDNNRHHDRFNYAYQHDRQAVTVVSRNDFRDSRPVTRSAAHMSEAVLLQSRVERAPSIQPNLASQGAGRARVQPEQQVFARQVVTRTPVSSNAASRAGAISSPRGAPQRDAATGTQSTPRTQAPSSTPARASVPAQPNQRTTVPRTITPRPQTTSPRELPPSRTDRPSGAVIDTSRSQRSQPIVGSQPPARAPIQAERSRTTAPSPTTPRTQPQMAVPQRTSPPTSMPRSQPQAVPRAAPQPSSRGLQSTPVQSSAPVRSSTPVRNSAPVPSSTAVPSSTPVQEPASTSDESESGQSSSPRGKPQRRAGSGIR